MPPRNIYSTRPIATNFTALQALSPRALIAGGYFHRRQVWVCFDCPIGPQVGRSSYGDFERYLRSPGHRDFVDGRRTMEAQGRDPGEPDLGAQAATITPADHQRLQTAHARVQAQFPHLFFVSSLVASYHVVHIVWYCPCGSMHWVEGDSEVAFVAHLATHRQLVIGGVVFAAAAAGGQGAV